MGIIKQGILGGFTGKVGSVVGTSWKGRAVMKAMPLSVANPRTSGQVAQRTAFSECVDFARQLVGGAILALDNPFSGNISGYNRFVSRNTENFPIGEAAGFENVKMSQGALGAVGIDTISTITAGDDQITVDFNSINSAYNLDTDVIFGVAYSTTRKKFLSTGNAMGARVVGSGVLNLDEEVVEGEVICVWISALRQDGKYVSNSDAQLADAVTA